MLHFYHEHAPTMKGGARITFKNGWSVAISNNADGTIKVTEWNSPPPPEDEINNELTIEDTDKLAVYLCDVQMRVNSTAAHRRREEQKEKRRVLMEEWHKLNEQDELHPKLPVLNDQINALNRLMADEYPDQSRKKPAS